MAARKHLNLLISALGRPDPVVQADAARLLGELRAAPAVAPLVNYVKTDRHFAKVAGFEALARIGDRAAAAELRPLVNDPNCPDDWYWYGCRSVRAAAAVALLALGDEGGAAYLAELADKNDDVFFCWFAPALLHLLDELPATRSLKARLTVEALTAFGARRTRQTEPGLRTMVAEALAIIGGDAAVAALRDMTASPSRYVRGQAALSLLKVAPTADHLALVAALAEQDGTLFVRVKAALALALADRRGWIRIIETAADTGPVGDGGAAGRAGQGGAAGADSAGEADANFDRAVAVEALGLLGHREHAALLERQAGHADAYVRLCALEALDRLQVDEAAGVAERGLKDKNMRVRLQAAKLLAARAEVK